MNILRRQPTYESITSGLRATIEQLDSLASVNADKIADNEVTIQALQASQKKLEDEANKSASTADKIRALLS